MIVDLEPELLHTPVGEGVNKYEDVYRAATAMFESANYIENFGPLPTPTEGDRVAAQDAFINGMGNPKQPKIRNSAAATHLKALLNEYDIEVVQSAAQIRSFVTNGLLEEAAPGSKNRIRALELLGKISDVGLFTERTEVTVRQKPTNEIEAQLRSKLETLFQNSATKVHAQELEIREVDMNSVMRATQSALGLSDVEPKP